MLLSVFSRIWHHLVFRDHGQGEFCIAAFGAIGWAAIYVVYPEGGKPQYVVLERLMPEHLWATWFFIFGALQIIGLFLRRPWCRLLGATGVFIALMCVFLSLVIVVPWTRGVSVYFAAMTIEACAMLFQTATIVRFRRGPKWTFKP